jgi:hypothetical protein
MLAAARSLRSLAVRYPKRAALRVAATTTTTTYSDTHTYATMASTSTSYAIPDKYGNFRRSAGPVNLKESYNQPINVTKWTSDKTGLRVVHVDVEGPLCNLYASVATEIFNDSGCPHTLEQWVPIWTGALNDILTLSSPTASSSWARKSTLSRWDTGLQ